METRLADGTPVRIRPIRPADVRWIIPAFRRLSPETVYQRFFTIMKELPADLARRFTNVDHVTRQALVAEISKGISYQPAGIARYEPCEQGGEAEVAVLVADRYQNRGIGRVLFHSILQAAVENGIHTFSADVLSENRRMMHLLQSETEIRESKVQQGVTHCAFTRKEESPS
jgi:RimJ/RimL family protein N-acetyltransferase